MLILYVLWLFCEWGCRETIGYLTNNDRKPSLLECPTVGEKWFVSPSKRGIPAPNHGDFTSTYWCYPPKVRVIHQKWGNSGEATTFVETFFCGSQAPKIQKNYGLPSWGSPDAFFFDVILWACMFNQIMTGSKPSIIIPFSPQRVYGLRWLSRFIPYCVRTLLRFRATLCLRHATRRWIGWTCCAMPLSKVGPRPRWIFQHLSRFQPAKIGICRCQTGDIWWPG